MKTKKYQKRFYREWNHSERFFKMQVIVQETDLLILSDKKINPDFVKERIIFYRNKISDYINYKDKRFLTALKPIIVELSAHSIIKDMSKESCKANVGPMASVAGAVAQYVGRDLLKKSCSEIIIENGGDIFLKVRAKSKVGLYAGEKNIFNNLQLEINIVNKGFGICTSSGNLGHSLSFGKTDAVVIVGENAILADAVATAVGNLVASEKDFIKAINYAKLVKGVKAAAIILGKNMACWGQIKFIPKNCSKE